MSGPCVLWGQDGQWEGTDARGCGTGDVRVFIGAVADLERGDALCQTRGKLRVDGGLHVYTVCAYACLARTAELARQDACEHMQLAHGT